jgi:addiction module HigA family antidote
MAKKLPPVHPGEILREEFLVPLKLTPYAVAAALNVPRTRIERIAREEKPVTADTALRLGKFFRTGAAFWMNIQARPGAGSNHRHRDFQSHALPTELPRHAAGPKTLARERHGAK